MGWRGERRTGEREEAKEGVIGGLVGGRERSGGAREGGREKE